MIRTSSMSPYSWEAQVCKSIIYRRLRTGALGSTTGVSSTKMLRISTSTLPRGPGFLTNSTFRVNLLHSLWGKLTQSASTLTCPSLRFSTRIKLLPSKAKKSPSQLRDIPPITPRIPLRSKRRISNRCLFLRKQNREGAMPRKSPPPPPPLLQGAGTLRIQSSSNIAKTT